ncbi:MAG: sigma-70 family RNA polymerase sigma factor [Verrucomicrobiota bacterium]|jgi:RNA polymerase sigma-70 factor (ECF subfamily)|nr:sigma-70 family RNA polymerase sigma factor [Chthoniobacteraceae bacterium]NBV33366.1 sigma-70 family RNA polymerase sigma factor [Pseudomonadota bacterium]
MLYSFDSRAELQSSLETQTDEMLLNAVKTNCKEALDELYRRHHTTLRAVIARVLHNDQSIEDLLQEVFVEIWRLATRYSSEKGKALGWMITLTRRRSIDRLRREQAYCRVEERYQKETETMPDAWTQRRGDDDVEWADMRRVLNTIVDTLPEPQRIAIQMAFFQGLSQREISAVTGSPLGTIKTRVELGIRKIGSKLRELSGESFPFFSAA